MKISEERITKALIKWLKNIGWVILAYDFPQSGTGKVFHPNKIVRGTTKNKNSFIPDIVCKKGNQVLIFENKDRFYYYDFEKLEKIKNKGLYSEDLNGFLDNAHYEIYYGVCFPAEEKYIDKAAVYDYMIDFLFVFDISGIDIVKVNENIKL